MRAALRLLGSFALVLIPVAVGLALVLQGLASRGAPTEREATEAVTAARVLTVSPQDYVPTVVSSGTVVPARTWSAVAQAAGDVVWIHPDLQAGRLIDAGVEILRIDATDYELAQIQAEAGLGRAEARLAELETQEKNLEANLAIARRGLALAETELERRQTLRGRDAASQATVDLAEVNLLERRAQVQEIENALRMIPVQGRAQEAERAIAEAQLAEARRKIAHTRISMPFGGRIAEVSVEAGQYAGVGQTMVVAHDIARAEIPVPLTPEQISTLVHEGIDIASALHFTAGEIDALPRKVGLEAEVQLSIGTINASWPATVDRLSFALDPQTRTANFVIGVDEPFRHARPGARPPLVAGMYVEAHISGLPKPGMFVLPRESIGRSAGDMWFVHVLDAEDRLQHRRVGIDSFAGNMAVVSDGLADGDRVIVSALGAPVVGMRIAPQEDAELAGRMSSAAARPAR